MTMTALKLVPDARTIQPIGDGWNNPTNDYAKTMIPAVETAHLNGWNRGNPWLASAKWKHPKQIRLVRDDGVFLAYKYRGRIEGTMLVRGFPADVHRVEATTQEPKNLDAYMTRQHQPRRLKMDKRKQDRKKPTRRTALEICEGFRMKLLKGQVLCMEQDEHELADACDEMGALLRNALKLRAITIADNSRVTPIDDSVMTSTIPASS